MTPINSILLVAFLFIAFGCAQSEQQGSRDPNYIPPDDTSVAVDASVEWVDSIAPQKLAGSVLGDLAQPSDTPAQVDTPAAKPDRILDVSNWKADDFIVSCPEFLRDEFRGDMEYYQEEWAGVKSPLVATFKGNEIGDYFHLNFEDEDGNLYDFGRGHQVNDFSGYVLYEGDGYADNQQLLHRKFKIFWEWKVAEYACCSGFYELVEAYVPAITGLELVGGE